MSLSPDAAVWLAITFLMTGAACWCVAAVLGVLLLVRCVRRATAKVTGRHRRRHRPAFEQDDATLILQKLHSGLSGPLARQEGEQ